jgi:hypothetical protein
MVEVVARAGCSRAPDEPPALGVAADRRGTGWCIVARLARPDLVASADGVLETGLRVIVADAGAADDDDLPDVSGAWEVADGEVRFRPDFPFEPGVQYRAILDLGTLGQPGAAEVLTHAFSFPKEAPGAEPEVRQVFPSSGVLPENLLRFYVRFSGPMRRGCAEANIEVLGPDGSPALDVLYRAPVELWDRSMACLTILLDPGRLKRGVGPNRMLGSPLRMGEFYTLVVGRGMIDAHGQRLRQRFVKAFIVSEAVRSPMAIEDWKIMAPAMDSRNPIELILPRPLDWAQLWQGITVASEDGERIKGRVDVDQDETRWRFTPDSPWGVGVYWLHVSPVLEDICGNTPYGAFDGPLRSADELTQETVVRSIPFEVTAA